MCEIANKIKNRRLELGLTLEDVAQAVGVGRSTVQRWESGLIQNMKRDKIAALAKVLQMDPVEFVPMPRAERESGTDQLSAEDKDRLEALHQNSQLRVLFDRSRKMKSADVDKTIEFIQLMFGPEDE